MPQQFVEENLLLGGNLGDPEEDNLLLLETPAITDQPMTEANTQAIMDQARPRPAPNRFGQVAVALSKWEDFTHNLENYGLKRRKGADVFDMLVNTTDQEMLEATHRFATTIGETFDASVIKGDRGTDLLERGRDRYLTFMTETGYDQVASAEQGRNLLKMFLFDEYHSRVQRSPERLRHIADVTYQSVLEEARTTILNTPDEQDKTSLLDDLAVLTQATPDERRDLIIDSLRQSSGFWPLPQNDVEETVFDDVSDKQFGKGMYVHRYQDRIQELNATMNRVTGSGNSRKMLANQYRDTQRIFNYQDSGFIDGDITKQGVIAVDRGLFTPVLFIPPDVLKDLEQKVVMRDIRVPGVINIDHTTIQDFQDRFSDNWEEQLKEHYETQRDDRIRRSASGFSPDPDNLNPIAKKNLNVPTRAFLSLGAVFEQAWGSVQEITDEIFNAPADIPGIGQQLNDAQKQWVLGLTGNAKLAQNSEDFTDALMVSFDLITENEGLLNRMLQSSRGIPEPSGLPVITPRGRSKFINRSTMEDDEAPTARTAPGAILRSTQMDTEALRALDPGTFAQAFSFFNQAPKLLAMGRENVDKEQEVRNARLAEVVKGDKSALTVNYLKDVAESMWYVVGSGFQAAFAEMIDRPQDIPLIIGAELTGDMTIRTMARARGSIFRSLTRGLALRRVSRQLAIHNPALSKRILSEMNVRMRSEQLAPDAKDAMRTALADAEAGLKETVEAKIAGAAKADGSVDRFAWGISKAYKHVNDLTPNGQIDALVAATPLYKKNSPWRAAAEFVRDFRGKAPRSLSNVDRDVMANLARQDIIRINQSLLSMDPAADLPNLRGELESELARATPDPAKVKQLSTTIQKKVGERSLPDSPAEQQKMVMEVDKIEAEMASLHRRMGDGDVPRIKERLVQLTDRHEQIRDRLRAPMDDFDAAQMLVWQDTGKFGYGPWARFKDGFHHIFAKATGRSLPDFTQALTIAERVNNFYLNEAGNFRIAQIRAAGQKNRLNHLFRRGREVGDQISAEVDAELAYTKARLTQDRATIGDAEEIGLREFEIAELEGRQQLINADNEALQFEHRRMLNNPLDQQWTLKDSILMERFFSDRDIVQMIDASPETFDFFNTDNFFRAGDLPNEAAALKKKLLERAEVLEAESERMAQQAKRIRPREPDPNLARPDDRALAQGLEEDPIIQLELRAAQRQTTASTLRRRAEELDARQRSWDPVPAKQRQLREFLSIDSMERKLADDVDDIKQISQTASANLYLQNGGDPWLASLLPMHMKARHLAGSTKATKFNLAAKAILPEALADSLNKMSPKERALALQAVRSGLSAEKLAETRPDVAAMLDQYKPSGRATIAKNIDDFVKHRSDLQAELLEEMRDGGFIEDAEYRNFRRAGYAPQMYGMFNLPNLVNTAQVSDLRRTFAGVGKGATGGGVDGEALLFQRDLRKHRVFVREKDGFIHDETFPSEQSAREFVQRRFGSRSIRTLEREGAFLRGKTTAGDEISIADPIGEELEKILDLPKQADLELQLKRFSDLQRDLAVHRFLISMKETGGLVLSDSEFADASLKQGAASLAFQQKYIRLPNLPRRYGSMSNHMVHRSVMHSLNDVSNTYDQLTSWVRGVEELFEGNTLFNKAKGVIGTTIDRTNQAAKASLILASFKTWLANVMFNVMTNDFTGGHVLKAANLDNLHRSIKEVIGSPRNRLRGEFADDEFINATRQGILNGGIFGQGADHLQRSLVRAFGLDDTRKIKSRLRQLQKLDEREADLIRTGDRDVSKREQIQLNKAALEAALKEAPIKGLRRLPREIFGFWFGGRTATGLPKSLTGKKIRDLYGNIDDVWRYATYLNLRREGKSVVGAADIVKKFMQNYGDLPPTVTRLSRSPIGALVTAFPYELGRLTMNYMRHKPATFASLLAIIPAVNTVGAFMAGVPLARVYAASRANGGQTSAESIENLMTQVQLWDPSTHEVVDTMDFTNSILPLATIASQYGPLAHAADFHFGGDDLGSSTMRFGMKGVGSFIMNNPVINTASAFIYNKDTVTGGPLLDRATARNKDYKSAFMRVLGRSIIPPWTPWVGRFADSLHSAEQAPLNPVTGRPYKGEETGTVLTRELINLPAKGRLAALFADMFGQPRKGEAAIVNDQLILTSLMFKAQKAVGGDKFGEGLPLFSVDRERRILHAQLATGSPQEKAVAEFGLRKLAEEQVEYETFTGKVARNKTEKQLRQYMKPVLQTGSPEYFSNRLDVEEQALVIMEAEAAAVRQETLRDYVEAASTTGIRPIDRPGRPKIPGDPGKIAVAMQNLERWMIDPRSGDASRRLYDWLLKVQLRSFRVDQRSVIRENVMQRLKDEGRIK